MWQSFGNSLETMWKSLLFSMEIRMESEDNALEIIWKSIGNHFGNHFGNPLKIQWKSLDFFKDPKEIRGEFIGNPFGNPLDIHL